ncbi:hypothetical protein GF337_13580 [candidate division KSB1 bacterium]|nr:hypothetical protein [candidate division KSB1 bacterium]
MPSLKDQVLHIVKSLPDDVSLDDIFAELYFKFQVDKGLQELDAGKGIPHSVVKDRMSQWIKK